MKSLSTIFTRPRLPISSIITIHRGTRVHRSFYSLLQPHPRQEDNENRDEAIYIYIYIRYYPSSKDGRRDPQENNSLKRIPLSANQRELGTIIAGGVTTKRFLRVSFTSRAECGLSSRYSRPDIPLTRDARL